MKIPIVHLQIVRENEADYHLENLTSPRTAAAWMKSIIGETDREKVVVCCLDNRMKPTCVEIAGIGSSNRCMFSVPELFKTALLSAASYILVFHTHPSGETALSQEDMEATEQIRKAGEMLGIEVLDHIILGSGDRYYSFRENEKPLTEQ